MVGRGRGLWCLLAQPLWQRGIAVRPHSLQATGPLPGRLQCGLVSFAASLTASGGLGLAAAVRTLGSVVVCALLFVHAIRSHSVLGSQGPLLMLAKR
jgi:hypothetical protein